MTEEKELNSLQEVHNAKKLIFGTDNIIASRYSMNSVDFGLSFKQTLSFKREEPTHKYFFTAYNLARIVNRLNLKEDNRTYIDLRLDLESKLALTYIPSEPNESFLPIPTNIQSKLYNVKQNTKSGFLNCLDYVYVSCDNNLYLYAYKNISRRQQMCMFEFEKNETIISVAIKESKSLIKNGNIYHLIVATPLRLYILLLKQVKDKLSISHFKKPLFCSTDGILYHSIQLVWDGRIFLAGSDGIVYNFNYFIRGEKVLRSMISRVVSDILPAGNRCSVSSTSILESFSNFLLPSFFRSRTIKKLVYDNKRDYLYVIYQGTSFALYSLKKRRHKRRINFSLPETKAKDKSSTEPEYKLLKFVPDISTEVSKYLQNPLHSIYVCGVLAQEIKGKANIADLCVIQNSDILDAVIVTTTGIRIYLSNAEIFHVRGPPSTTAPVKKDLISGVSPSASLDKHQIVSCCACSSIDGQVVMCLNLGQTKSSVLSFTPDTISRRYDPNVKIVNVLPTEQAFHETFQESDLTTLLEKLEKKNIKVLEIKESSSIKNIVGKKPFKNLFLSNQNGSHKYYILTTAGVIILKRRFVTDILYNILYLNISKKISIMKPVLLEDFFYSFGLIRASVAFLATIYNCSKFGRVKVDDLLNNFFSFGFMNHLLPRWHVAPGVEVSNAVLSNPTNIDFSGCFLGYISMLQYLIQPLLENAIFETKGSTKGSTKSKIQYYLFAIKESEISQAIEYLILLTELKQQYISNYAQLVNGSVESDPLYSQISKKECDFFTQVSTYTNRALQGLQFIRILLSKFRSITLANVNKEDADLKLVDIISNVRGTLFAERIIYTIATSKSTSELSAFSYCPAYVSENKIKMIELKKLISKYANVDDKNKAKIQSLIRMVLDDVFKFNSSVSTNLMELNHEKERKYFLRKSQVFQLTSLFINLGQEEKAVFEDICICTVNIILSFVPGVEDSYANDCFTVFFKAFLEYVKHNKLNVVSCIEGVIAQNNNQRFSNFIMNFLFDSSDLRSVLNEINTSCKISWFENMKNEELNFESSIIKQDLIANTFMQNGEYIRACKLFYDLALVENPVEEKGVFRKQKKFLVNLSRRLNWMQACIIAHNSIIPSEQESHESPILSLLDIRKKLETLQVQQKVLAQVQHVAEKARKLNFTVYSLNQLYNEYVYPFKLYEEGICMLALGRINDDDELDFLTRKVIKQYMGQAETINKFVIQAVTMLLCQYYPLGYFRTEVVVKELEKYNFENMSSTNVIDIFLRANLIPYNLLDVYLRISETTTDFNIKCDIFNKMIYLIKQVNENYEISESKSLVLTESKINVNLANLSGGISSTKIAEIKLSISKVLDHLSQNGLPESVKLQKLRKELSLI